MIKSFLFHHVGRARRGEITNALKNCHVRGLTSIMLHDEPGNRIRLFFAQIDHELHRNGPTIPSDMTLGIHPHHSDITLIRVFGRPQNWVFNLQANSEGPLHQCLYSSQINDGKGGLFPTSARFSVAQVNGGDFHELPLRADVLHTVYVPKNEVAAWLVIEGKKDPSYEPVCYTANPVFNPDGMYQKIETENVAPILEVACHLAERNSNERHC
jgi:hypothetical protein